MKLESTLSQIYFLIVGKLTHTTKGFRILEKGDILKRFLHLVCQVQHECYIKLIVASLSYREEYCKWVENNSHHVCNPVNSVNSPNLQLFKKIIGTEIKLKLCTTHRHH